MEYRSRLWKTIVVSLLFSSAMCTDAVAGCESLFEYGIYDIDGKTSDADRTASFRQWVCQREFPAKADAVKFAAVTGVPAEVLPIKLRESESEFRESYVAFCADADLNSPLNQNLSKSLSGVNRKMLDKFNACVSPDGLHAWITQTKEPARFNLHFLHKNAGGGSKPVTVITITRFNALCENLRLPFELAGAEKIFSCARTDPTNQSSLWILASEPVMEGSNFWVGKTTYTPPTATMPASP